MTTAELKAAYQAASMPEDRVETMLREAAARKVSLDRVVQELRSVRLHPERALQTVFGVRRPSGIPAGDIKAFMAVREK